jgi:hypothetical protein
MRHVIHDTRISSGQWPRCDVTYSAVRYARFLKSYEIAGPKTYTCQKEMHFLLLSCLYSFISLLLQPPAPRIMRLDSRKVSVYKTRYTCSDCRLTTQSHLLQLNVLEIACNCWIVEQ